MLRLGKILLCQGDILQSMAFEVLGSRLFDEQGQGTDAAIVLKQMQILATASSKMVSGQVLDLQAEGKQITKPNLKIFIAIKLVRSFRLPL